MKESKRGVQLYFTVSTEFKAELEEKAKSKGLKLPAYLAMLTFKANNELEV